MEVTEPFSMTLTNKSTYFADNSIYSFRTAINPPLEIPFKKFEVGVSKVILPKTTNPYLPKSVFFIGIVFEDNVPRGYQKRFEHEVTIEAGIFTSVDHMMQHIEDTIRSSIMEFYMQHPQTFDIERDLFPSVWCRVLLVQNHVYISKVTLGAVPDGYPYNCYIRVKSSLEMWHNLEFLNFTQKQLITLPIRARYPPSLNVIMTSLVVYAPDLIVEQLIGEQLRPVLEMIPYSANTNEEFIIYSVTNPIYKTVIGGYINRIHIEIQEISSKQVYFDPGKVQIHLHFRPCQPLTNQ